MKTKQKWKHSLDIIDLTGVELLYGVNVMYNCFIQLNA